MKSSNITTTDARLINALKRVEAAKTSVSGTAKGQAGQNQLFYTGKLKKYYYEWDRLEIQTQSSVKIVRMTHPVAGSCFVDFTPFGERLYDNKRGHNYFRPLEQITCIVINAGGYDWCIGFAQDNVEKPKLLGAGALMLAGYSDKLVISGGKGTTFDTSQLVFKDWTDDEQWNQVATADITQDNLTNEAYYSKEEVDEMFKKLREELGLEVTES